MSGIQNRKPINLKTLCCELSHSMPNDPDNLPLSTGGKLSLEEFEMGLNERAFTSDCEHGPDQLDLIDSEYQGDAAVFIFHCSCGESITEIFRHTDTRKSD